MRRLRQLCGIAVLTFALACSTYAGEIECGVISAPMPPEEVAGEMQNGVERGDTVAEAMLSMIEAVVSLAW